jgi:hypothetical protein
MCAPASNGRSGASVNGLILRYSLILLYFIGFIVKFILTLNTGTCLVSLIIIIKLLINCICNFRIKMYPKIPIFLRAKVDEFQSYMPPLMVPRMQAPAHGRILRVAAGSLTSVVTLIEGDGGAEGEAGERASARRWW